MEPSVKNFIFCKEFERHFVNINIPTLLNPYDKYLRGYQDDDMVDPFDDSKSFNSVPLDTPNLGLVVFYTLIIKSAKRP